jgi:hypothetical protein
MGTGGRELGKAGELLLVLLLVLLAGVALQGAAALALGEVL